MQKTVETIIDYVKVSAHAAVTWPLIDRDYWVEDCQNFNSLTRL